MSLPRYPVYKDSGVSWLGEVPAHWDVCRLKSKLSLRTEKAERRIFPVALENIEGWTGRYLETETEFQGDGVSFDSGDILFGKLRPYLAKVLLAKCAGEAVGDFHVLRPSNDIVGRYAQYQMLTRNFIDFVNGETFGSKMPRASWDSLGGMPFVSPSPSEQVKIATFLDRETAKIDALIAEQEKLIALLAEKRQATISRAVTRGLDPNVPLKESGVPWLGKVPAHWEVKALRRVVSLNPSKSEVAHFPKDSEVSFLPMEAIGENGDLILDRFRKLSEVETGYTYFRNGDVTIAKITPCFENGKGGVMTGLLNGFGFGTTELIVVRPNLSFISSGYLNCIFRSKIFRLEGEGSMYGAGGQKRVSDDFVRNLIWAIPPASEQLAIERFINTQSQQFELLKSNAQTGISLLKERRAALISAAVTGKIDVRGLAA